MRQFLLAIGLAVLIPALSRAAGPTCALLDPEKTPRAALLETKLLTEPGATWVERANIDAVLKEQKLQALFTAQGVGDRLKLGRLLKADLLIMVRPVKDAKEPAIEVIISETASGLRLLVRAVPVTKDADADVAALLATTRDGIKRHGEKIAEIVAVPPFISQDLELHHDHLKGAFAKLAEADALGRKGVVVVELEEAEALAKEIALAAPGSRIARPLPVYLLGEFRHDGKGKDQSVELKLRAERGGKPVGRPESAKLKPEESPAAVRRWSAGVLDGLTKGDKPRAQVDPKFEAKQLAARAREFGRLANWTESLALIEASLLLDPEQIELRVDAIRALTPAIASAWLKGHRDFSEVERYARLYRRGLEHLEAFHAQGGDVVRYRAAGGHDFVAAFLGSTNNLVFSGSPSRQVIDLMQELRKVQLEVFLRIVLHVAKHGKGEETFYIPRALSHLSPREKYERIEQIIAELRDLPEPTRRVVAYASQGYVAPPDTPEYRAFLDRLDASKDKALQDAAIQLREKLKQNAVRQIPPMGDRTGPGPTGVKLTAVALSFGSPEPGARTRALEGVLAVGPGVDILWSLDALYVMKEKGKLRLLWRSPAGEELFGFSTVIFDGKYVWATAVRPRENPFLLLLDPQTDKVWDLSTADGIPQFPKRELAERSITLFAAPLEAGRAWLAGSFSNRAWIGIATFDATSGKGAVKVIHEAREAQDLSDKEQWRKTTVGFTPRFLVALTTNPGPDGNSNRRVLVGRMTEGNFPIREHPLVIEPDQGIVEVLKEKLWSSIQPKQSAVIEGAAYFPVYHEGDRYQLRRLGLPGLASEFVCKLPSIFAQPTGAVVAHNGRMHVIFEEGLKRQPGTDGRPQVTRQYQWWTVDRDGENARQVANGLPSLNEIGVSAHYGLIALTGGGRGVPATLHTVEFPASTPKKR